MLFFLSIFNVIIRYYVIVDFSNGFFVLSENSGEIIIVFEFDRDILSMFKFVFIVYVVDVSGLSLRISSIIVEIILLDKNDNFFIFE